MPWERRTPTVVDRHSREKIPWVVAKFSVVEKSMLVIHSRWH